MSAPVRVVSVLLVLLAVAGGGFLLGRRSAEAPAAIGSGAVYRCPMHPQVVSDKPGECPICHMTLVRTAMDASRSVRRVLYYRNPMDASVRSATPAKDSMGMDYVPVYEDEVTGGGPPVAGRAAVTIPPERRQVLGLRSEPVRKERLARRIRTVGIVAVDERRVHRVQTKYEGYVERVFVDFTGRRVRRGEPLLALYSPELLATQQEYLAALRTRKQLERERPRPRGRAGLRARGRGPEEARSSGTSPRPTSSGWRRRGRPRARSPSTRRRTATSCRRTWPMERGSPPSRSSSRSWTSPISGCSPTSTRATSLRCAWAPPGEVRVAYRPGRSWSGRVT